MCGPPDENQAKLIIKFDLKKDDPSKFYEILGKIGCGGFAKVFKVRRKNDNLICALKFF